MGSKLGEKGMDQVAAVLFVGVSKVEIKITHIRLSGFAHGFDVLDDCRTDRLISDPNRDSSSSRTRECSFLSQL